MLSIEQQQTYLQTLHDLPLEEGKAYLQTSLSKGHDASTIGAWLEREALDKLYTPFISLKIAELLTYLGEHVNNSSLHALGLKAKGDALVQIQHFQAAMQCLDEAGDSFLALGDESNWARSRISWITACAWLGHVEEALVEAARAHDTFIRLNEPYWACVINHNVAVFYYYTGRYNDAALLYQNILSMYSTLKDRSNTDIRRSVALAKMNLATFFAWSEKFVQAQDMQKEAYNDFRMLEEIDLAVNSQISLADLEYSQSYYGSALHSYYQARDLLLHHSVDDPILVADLKLWIARCLVKLNRAEEACILSEDAVKVYREFDISLSTGNVLREYAATLIAAYQEAEALTILQEALTLFKQGGFDYFTFAVQLQEAEVYLKIGKAQDAYKQALYVKAYYESQGLVEYALQAGLIMVEASLAQITKENKGGIYDATLLCKQLLQKARQHNFQEASYKCHFLLGHLEVLRENTRNASRHYRAAIAQIERILDDLAYDLSPSFLHSTWMVYEEMIALYLGQGQIAHAFNYLEQARSMALRQYLNKRADTSQSISDTPSQLQVNNATMLRMHQELKDWQERYRDACTQLASVDILVSSDIDRSIIQAEIKHCEAEISERFERLHLSQASLSQPIKKRRVRRDRAKTITQIGQQLASDQLMLTYFLSQGKILIFVLTKEGVVSHEVPDGIERLERLLPLLHARLLSVNKLNAPSMQQQAVLGLLKKLYDLLIAPVASHLPSSGGTLTIVPYGPLHTLPFHALYDGSRYLIEDFQIQYLPMSSMVVGIGRDKSGPYSHVGEPSVFGYSGNGHLQRTIEEAKAVASILNGQCYLENDATIARLSAEAPHSSIIHIATHGQSRLDAPNFSSLLLADGRLNAIDAFGFDLQHCELVTLSGCQTGLSLSGGGDEQLGLGRAFLATGAKSLVMSLWPVEDMATNELMQHFYRYLLQGEGKAQALRSAQRYLLQQPDYAHPYFWAAFRLVGDIAPLAIHRSLPF
jgi:CHAT domain-containing protein